MRKPKNSCIALDYDQEPYGREEDVSLEECASCNGSGYEYYSDCCGAVVDDYVCQDCRKICSISCDNCDECNGEGEVEA